MRQEFIPYAVAFREPIPTAAGAWTVRRGEWLRLESEDGLVGLGEAAPPAPLEAGEAPVEVLDPASIRALAPERGPHRAVAQEPGPYRAAALDLARLDIEAQREGRNIAALLCAAPRDRVRVNALCFSTGIVALAAEAARAVESGFRTVKLKVGAAPPEHDIARILAVRERVGEAIAIRVDANGAWDEATALQVLGAVARCDLEYVEDPVKGDPRAIRERLGMAVASDPRTTEDAWKVVRTRGADVLVLKPLALGGVRVTRDLARAALEAGLGVVITSVFDTAVGVAGALHLAASLPGAERAHGLATVGYLEETPVEGLAKPRGGEMRVPKGPGLGVHLRDRTP